MTAIRSREERQLDCVTGRDGYIIRKALAYAIETIELLPSKWQEWSDKEDMIRLLEAATPKDRADSYRLGVRRHLEGGLKVITERAARDDNVVHFQK